MKGKYSLVKKSYSRFSKLIVSGLILTLTSVTTVFGQIGTVTANKVNVRTAPSSNAAIVKFLNTGDSVEIETQTGSYYKISQTGNSLFIHSDYVKIATSQYAVVKTTSGVNVRHEPSQQSKIMFAVTKDSAVDVISIEGDWVKVKINNQTGYMAKEYLSINQGEKPAQAVVSTTTSTNGSKADNLISYAKKFIGTPYRYGGTSLTKGVDCSGFVQSVFKHLGISLNRTSSGMASNGSRVTRANLQKGDVVFFDTSGANNSRISHVGIYIGNGQFIHSSSTKKRGISIASLNSSPYTRQFVTARRMF